MSANQPAPPAHIHLTIDRLVLVDVPLNGQRALVPALQASLQQLLAGSHPQDFGASRSLERLNARALDAGALRSTDTLGAAIAAHVMRGVLR